MHMLTGKTISRAIRAQLIVDAVLSALVLAKTFNVSLRGSSDDRNVEIEEFLEATTSSREKSARHPDLDEAAVLYEKVMQGSMSADQVCQSGVITRIGDVLQRETKSLKSYRTATLWLQYMDMVDILRMYIRESILATGNCISKLFQKCSLTWPNVDSRGGGGCLTRGRGITEQQLTPDMVAVHASLC
ncbi:uncharacterized protein LOC134178048 [Corticium candelabrum]|uniref:uncharacterized protein LOC134178048 n=1 Tax=Corticium candelabrum TaxID=121492 RepID=UPI002E268306|nr:uncharacterized protein LOC134178048 [Corticium candelabrum]